MLPLLIAAGATAATAPAALAARGPTSAERQQIAAAIKRETGITGNLRKAVRITRTRISTTAAPAKWARVQLDWPDGRYSIMVLVGRAGSARWSYLGGGTDAGSLCTDIINGAFNGRRLPDSVSRDLFADARCPAPSTPGSASPTTPAKPPAAPALTATINDPAADAVSPDADLVAASVRYDPAAGRITLSATLARAMISGTVQWEVGARITGNVCSGLTLRVTAQPFQTEHGDIGTFWTFDNAGGMVALAPTHDGRGYTATISDPRLIGQSWGCFGVSTTTGDMLTFSDQAAAAGLAKSGTRTA
jgi:hypothetical protein